MTLEEQIKEAQARVAELRAQQDAEKESKKPEALQRLRVATDEASKLLTEAYDISREHKAEFTVRFSAEHYVTYYPKYNEWESGLNDWDSSSC